MNSVPFLIGCAVVRQPAGPDAVAAEVGRNPWLFDRRLTTLQLPDDTLPANRAVALDWPVPYQAEWVGVPPRLLISRLVFADRTVGVLLGTLITREPLNAQTREALDLSCELIASAMAMYSAASQAAQLSATPVTQAAFEYTPPHRLEPAAVEPAAVEPAPPPAPVYVTTTAPVTASDAPPLAPGLAAHIDRIAAQIRVAVESASDARAIGRILRDAMNEVSEASAFSVALYHANRLEVAYRYKVVGVDAASSELGKQAVDDSPSCFAVRNGERWHAFDRAITVAGERQRVGVVQIPLIADQDAIGVVTLQTFREGGFAQGELALIAGIVGATMPGFAAARAADRFQPSTAAPAPAPAPVAVPVAAVAPSPAPAVAAPEPVLSTDDILRLLLEQCATVGLPTSFIVGLDPEAGMLRGDRVSTSPEAGGIDRFIGISDARFAVSIDDRYNAIARACREARIVSAPTVHELLQPVHDWNEATLIERMAGGGRSAIAPILVNGDVVGALIAGPRADEFSAGELSSIAALVESASARLGVAWRAATIGAAAVEVPAEALQQARANVA
ncbi:MAG: GAF domain-containing protein [Chloroflexota bacterium]